MNEREIVGNGSPNFGAGGGHPPGKVRVQEKGAESVGGVADESDCLMVPVFHTPERMAEGLCHLLSYPCFFSKMFRIRAVLF